MEMQQKTVIHDHNYLHRHKKRTGKIEIPMDDLVVGDIVHLSAGDMIPADVRILDAKDLFISQASLTGESEPVEKTPKVCAQKESITDYSNIAFMGSNVISGSATAVVVCTGDRTLFGSMASAIAGEAVETSFTKGVNAVSWVLIRFMLVMVPLVFLSMVSQRETGWMPFCSVFPWLSD